MKLLHMHLEPDIFFGTNICTIHLYHMDWQSDSLYHFLFLFLSLIFNIVCTIDSTLFPGKIHYKSSSKYLEKIRLKYGEEIMREFRVDIIENIGIYSLRKGSTSCISFKSIFSPTQVATNIRARWLMGIIQDNYFCDKAVLEQL